MRIYTNEKSDVKQFITDIEKLGYRVTEADDMLIVSCETDDGAFNFSILILLDRFECFPAHVLNDNGFMPTAVSYPPNIPNRISCDVITFSKSNIDTKTGVPVYRN